LGKPVEIAVKPNAAYVHQSTGIVFPGTLAGLERSRVVSVDTGDLDVTAIYSNGDESELASVFVFRNVSADVPVWFDRAASQVEQRTGLYGAVTPVIRAAPFVPPGQSAASGLKSVYATSSKPFTSTAVALAPVGGFYVKVRLSSATLNPAQLDALLTKTLQGLVWPSVGTSRPAFAVEPCASPIKLGRKAKRAPTDLASALVGATLAVPDQAVKAAKPASPPRWCRDSGAVEGAAVYRPGGSSDTYLIAMQDSGRAVSVGRNELGALVARSNTPRYSVELILLSETLGYGDFRSPPPPQQAMRLLDQTNPLYRTSTTGEGSEITLNSGLVKK
jgi:hypothetical protein